VRDVTTSSHGAQLAMRDRMNRSVSALFAPVALLLAIGVAGCADDEVTDVSEPL
jgi:hypothetical protein